MTFTSSWFKETNLNMLYKSNVLVIFIKKMSISQRELFQFRNIFILLDYLIFFYFKNIYFWTYFLITNFFSTYMVHWQPRVKSPGNCNCLGLFLGMQLPWSYLVANLRCVANKRRTTRMFCV
jgi:hypothetical protein